MHGQWFDLGMRELAAYGSLIGTVALVIARPQLWRVRLGPGVVGVLGVLMMAAAGIVTATDVVRAAETLWRPLLGVGALLVTTRVAERLLVLEWMTDQVEVHARGDAVRRAVLLFLVAGAAAAVMNNDAAFVTMTPLAVALARRAHPGRPDLVIPYALAVFLSAGVAPFMTSNPMNMVVATSRGIGFMSYAGPMLPAWLAGAVATLAMFLAWAWPMLRAAPRAAVAAVAPAPMTPAVRIGLVLLVAPLCAYPLLEAAGAGVWAAACVVAAGALAVARRHGHEPVALVRGAISLDILLFLVAACVLARGLLHVGAVDRLAVLYADSGPFVVGLVSAAGSALLNNHPMSHLNVLALEAGRAAPVATLAALVGGDLGPRLLPIGSLAGLLFLESLALRRVHLPLGRFMVVGALTAIPALLASLGVLALLS
jgi:arsenical pump membrane protein